MADMDNPSRTRTPPSLAAVEHQPIQGSSSTAVPRRGWANQRDRGAGREMPQPDGGAVAAVGLDGGLDGGLDSTICVAPCSGGDGLCDLNAYGTTVTCHPERPQTPMHRRPRNSSDWAGQ
jgi:hypothetical protein